ncbi:Ribokinase-like protein [Meredithblackwellia eburnea MCA 4105]
MITTLGTALLDSFEWEEKTELVNDQNGEELKRRGRETRMGGGGVFWTVGARIWLKPDQVGQLVQRGPDFPSDVQETMDSFGPIWYYIDVETPTPHALNTYTVSGTRKFQHLTPPPPLTPASLFNTALSQPTHLHLCCSPSHLLTAVLPTLPCPPPELIYEPIPYACTPESLLDLRKILSSILVFSPNDDEAPLFFPSSSSDKTSLSVEELAKKFRELGARNIVIRSGARGSFVLSEGDGEGVWVAPYHTKETKDRVRDTVGAGNSFLGGLMAGLVLSKAKSAKPSLIDAVQRGAISAGFMIEQAGFPRFRVDSDKKERWNDDLAEERLTELRLRS